MSGGGGDLVSVIIPAFNAAATIVEAIESVQHQTYRRLEILVVDDGSADGTDATVAEIARHDKRVRLIRLPNRGIAAARNHALSVSQGCWIAPIDADDLWHPTKLARQWLWIKLEVWGLSARCGRRPPACRGPAAVTGNRWDA